VDLLTALVHIAHNRAKVPHIERLYLPAPRAAVPAHISEGGPLGTPLRVRSRRRRWTSRIIVDARTSLVHIYIVRL